MSGEAKKGRAKLDARTAREFRERLTKTLELPPFSGRRGAVERLGVGERTVDSWYSARGSLPDFPITVRLCRLTGISLNWLVFGIGQARVDSARGSSLEEQLSGYVSEQVAMRRGVTAATVPDEEAEVDAAPTAMLRADGSRLLEACVTQALASFDAWVLVLHERTVIMRAAEEIAAVGAELPELADRIPPRTATTVREQARRIERALLGILPDAKAAPLVWFADTEQATEAQSRLLRSVTGSERTRLPLFPEIRRTLEAMRFQRQQQGIAEVPSATGAVKLKARRPR